MTKIEELITWAESQDNQPLKDLAEDCKKEFADLRNQLRKELITTEEST